jgi:NTP pyrophosphatase (non-canonical NTP hydrolase)
MFDKIRQWANDRNFIEGSSAQAQTVKLFEEGGELACGVAKKNLPLVKDSIGDMVVVLTIIASQYGWTIEECIEAAYQEIKDRKGKMVDGMFIREGA